MSNSELSEVSAKRNALHYLIHMAFVEIRASESTPVARRLADVFHVLPLSILKASTDDEYEAELGKLLERAKRHGLEHYIQELWQVSQAAAARLPLVSGPGASQD